jgi:hypothetical protein
LADFRTSKGDAMPTYALWEKVSGGWSKRSDNHASEHEARRHGNAAACGGAEGLGFMVLKAGDLPTDLVSAPADNPAVSLKLWYRAHREAPWVLLAGGPYNSIAAALDTVDGAISPSVWAGEYVALPSVFSPSTTELPQYRKRT